jgi:hypothetical protein
MRTKVVREIVNSEESYVRSLSLLVKTLYDPLMDAAQKGTPILSIEHIKGIFSHIKGTILSINEMKAFEMLESEEGSLPFDICLCCCCC